ncbi:MAG: hypothetical protein RXR41_03600 [Candidatus Marsarchaeota archaeon]
MSEVPFHLKSYPFCLGSALASIPLGFFVGYLCRSALTQRAQLRSGVLRVERRGRGDEAVDLVPLGSSEFWLFWADLVACLHPGATLRRS